MFCLPWTIGGSAEDFRSKTNLMRWSWWSFHTSDRRCFHHENPFTLRIWTCFYLLTWIRMGLDGNILMSWGFAIKNGERWTLFLFSGGGVVSVWPRRSHESFGPLSGLCWSPRSSSVLALKDDYPMCWSWGIHVCIYIYINIYIYIHVSPNYI